MPAQKGREQNEQKFDTLRLVQSNPGLSTDQVREELGMKNRDGALKHLNYWAKAGLVYPTFKPGASYYWHPVLRQSMSFFVLSKKWDENLKGYLSRAACCHLEPYRQQSAIPPRNNASETEDLARYFEDIQSAARAFGQSEKCPMGGIRARHQNQCSSLFQNFDE